MTRPELRELFKRHKGSAKRAAGRTGLTATSVSRWLKSEMNSVPIETSVLHVAKELLAKEAPIEKLRREVSRLNERTAKTQSAPIS